MERLFHARFKWALPHFTYLYGFQPKKSTTDAIVQLLSYVTAKNQKNNKSVSQNKKLVAAFLVLDKAFKRVNSTPRLFTLALHGVKGTLLKWTQAYLQDRSTRVKFQRHFSDYHSYFFSSAKTKMVEFHSRGNQHTYNIDGVPIDIVSDVKYIVPGYHY